jgi:two-component system cell cycle response regulator DivK
MTTRVLVIEDHPPSLDLVRYLLVSMGYEALVAEDGLSGLALAEAEIPDLVICDIQMPGLDGYQVLARLRANPRLASIPVVAVTAFSMVGDRRRILEAGFEGYIPKPIIPEAFVAQVTAYLPPERRIPVPGAGG